MLYRFRDICRMTLMAWHIMMEIGLTTSDRDSALDAIHLAIYMKGCGTKTGDMGLVQCTGLIVISHTLAIGKMVFR